MASPKHNYYGEEDENAPLYADRGDPVDPAELKSALEAYMLIHNKIEEKIKTYDSAGKSLWINAPAMRTPEQHNEILKKQAEATKILDALDAAVQETKRELAPQKEKLLQIIPADHTFVVTLDSGERYKIAKHSDHSGFRYFSYIGMDNPAGKDSAA